MSILGLTIDYGPYGWLEDFDPELDAQHHRRRPAPLPLRRPAAGRHVEPAAAGERPVAADRRPEPLQDGAGALRRALTRPRRRMTAAQAGAGARARRRQPLVDELLRAPAWRRPRSTSAVLPRPGRGAAPAPDAADDALLAPLADACYTPDEVARRRRARPRRLAAPLGPTRARPAACPTPSAAGAWTPSTRASSCATTWPRRPSTPPRRATPRWSRAARRPAPPLRRAARPRALRRQAPGVGAPPGRLLDAVLQLVAGPERGGTTGGSERQLQPQPRRPAVAAHRR